MTPVDPLAVAQRIAGHLEAVGLRYVVGGSVASSLLGEPRSTLDLDIMIEADREKVRALVRRLGDTCYVDEESALEAVEERRSFNAIDLRSAMKIDFFIAEDASFAGEAMSERREVEIPGIGRLYFYAAEDLIIRKLVWFRLGDESSERQWRDVVSLLRLNRGRLDLDRLERLTRETGVSDLLRRATEELESQRR